MSWTGVSARVVAVLFVVGGVIVAAAAFSTWFREAHEGYGVDLDGEIGRRLQGTDADRIDFVDVLDDDCDHVVVVPPGTPEAVYEPLVGNADSDVADSAEHSLVVAIDDSGNRVHAEHVPVATGLSPAEPRRLVCSRLYTVGQLRSL